MVTLTIDGRTVQAQEGATILEAAAQANIHIPHLCYLKGINEIAACRVCCVEVEGERAMVTACNNPVKEGMVVHTNSPRVRTTRRINVELILSQHDCKCATCVRSGNCQLQTIANDLGIVKVHYEPQLPRGLRGAWTTTFPLYHDYNKCIKCMRCIQVCDKVQTLSIWDVSGTGGRTMIDVSGNRVMKDSDCALCGQCITHCPTGGLRERDDTMEVFSALADPDKITVVQVAPAVRTAWGEAFGLPREQATMERMAAALRRGESTAQAIQAIRAQNQDIQKERAVLLGAIGLPEDALDDKPACPLCGDTGWRGAQMCQCLKKLCTQEQIRELSKLLDLGEQSFDSFRLDYYSQTPWPGRGASPRENMELVYEVCLNYAQKFGRFYFKNLFLSGAPGLGKTFLSACIARTVSEEGFSVVYDTAGNIFAQFELKKFQRDAQDAQEAKDETRRYLNCDLLILDDLGSELTTQFTQSALYELVNTRLVAGRCTVISSNLSMDEAARRYSPQIASRLAGEYHVLHFFGDDIRLLKKQRM